MEPEVSEFWELIKKAIISREYLKWVAFALRLIKMFEKEISLEAKDLVSEIILKVCTGKRKWNRKVDIDRFMYLNISSYFYNLCKRQKRLVYEEDKEDDNGENDPLADIIMSKSPDYIIERYDIDNILGKCLNKLDANEKRVLIELNEGATPYEVSIKMGLDRTKVYAIRNRIKSKIGRLLIN